MICSSVCPFFGMLNLLDFFRGPQLPQYLYFQLVQFSGFGSPTFSGTFMKRNYAAKQSPHANMERNEYSAPTAAGEHRGWRLQKNFEIKPKRLLDCVSEIHAYHFIKCSTRSPFNLP